MHRTYAVSEDGGGARNIVSRDGPQDKPAGAIKFDREGPQYGDWCDRARSGAQFLMEKRLYLKSRCIQPEYVQLKSNADFSFVSPPYAGIVRSLLPTNPPGPRGTVDVN